LGLLGTLTDGRLAYRHVSTITKEQFETEYIARCGRPASSHTGFKAIQRFMVSVQVVVANCAARLSSQPQHKTHVLVEHPTSPQRLAGRGRVQGNAGGADGLSRQVACVRQVVHRLLPCQLRRRQGRLHILAARSNAPPAAASAHCGHSWSWRIGGLYCSTRAPAARPPPHPCESEHTKATPVVPTNGPMAQQQQQHQQQQHYHV